MNREIITDEKLDLMLKKFFSREIDREFVYKKSDCEDTKNMSDIIPD